MPLVGKDNVRFNSRSVVHVTLLTLFFGELILECHQNISI